MQGFDELVDRLKDNTLLPFVGAGTSRAVLSRNGRPAFPTWRELLEAGTEYAGNQGAEVRSKLAEPSPDLLGIADALYQLLGKNRWNRLLRNKFDRQFSEIQPESLTLPSAIWKLRPPTVITTNYDRVMYWTCPEAQRNDLRIHALDNGVDIQAVESSTQERPVLVYLHGRIEHPSTLVLRPEGYDRLYAPTTGTTERAYKQALFVLRNLVATRSLLFIGWSASDLQLIKAMRDVQDLFIDSPIEHFVLSRKGDEKTIRKSLEKQCFDAEIVLFDDFGIPLLEFVENLGRAAGGRAAFASLPAIGASPNGSTRTRSTMPSKPGLFLRRRCRSVPADIATNSPPLLRASAEGHTNKDHLALLGLTDHLSTLPSLLTESLSLEFNGRIELMELQLSQAALIGIEEGYRRLYHGFALEKLYLLERAIDDYEWIIRNDFGDDDLIQSARFNKAICLEKLNEFDQAHFGEWVNPDGHVLRNGDAIWLKALSMTLISSARQGTTSEFEHLVPMALTSERQTNPGGYAKTLINWAIYAREPLEEEAVLDVIGIAGEQSTNTAVGLLKYCYELTDPINRKRLRATIEASLDAAVARSSGSETVRRFHA